MSTHRRTVGDTYPLKATITKNGEPVDITGASGTFNFKKASGELISIVGVITDGPGGAIQFSPTADQVVTDGRYKFNIKLTQDGIVTTYLKGELILEDDI